MKASLRHYETLDNDALDLSSVDSDDDDTLGLFEDVAPSRTGKISSPFPTSHLWNSSNAEQQHTHALPKEMHAHNSFGLEYAPVYFPSEKEFSDPIKYITQISGQARPYGACKIVPPAGWKMPCNFDRAYLFRALRQYNASWNATNRAAAIFADQVMQFHAQFSPSKQLRIPEVDDDQLDIWCLAHHIRRSGGIEAVERDDLWHSILERVWPRVQLDEELVDIVRWFFLRDVQPVLEYVGFDSMSPLERSANCVCGVPVAEGSNSESALSCHGCKVPFHAECIMQQERYNSPIPVYCGPCLSRFGNAFSSSPSQVHNAESFERLARGFKQAFFRENLYLPHDFSVKIKEQYAEAFQKRIRGGKADPSLNRSRELLAELFDVGAKSISDSMINDIAEQLCQASLTGSLSGRDLVELESYLEECFWEFTNNAQSTNEVQYANDLTPQGRLGMPTPQSTSASSPAFPYTTDPWNLNVLPIVRGSLLRYLQEPMEGLIAPWVYLGMLFSAFAWHKEDHYVYSINYSHFGESKMWYCVPDEQDVPLQKAVQAGAPELFKNQSDIMKQMITVASPQLLREHGVRVYAISQRPNEFVITFPRAYHSGFNLGLNCNEAVNFALPDWLPVGRKAMQDYREIHRNPMFSHDHLLVSLALSETDPTSLHYVMPQLRDRINEERSKRSALVHLNMQIISRPDKLALQVPQCRHCNAFSFFSYVQVNSRQCVCLDCALDKGSRGTLTCLFADEELDALSKKHASE